MFKIKHLFIILLLTVLTGAAMGLIAAAFLKLLDWVTLARENNPFLIAFLPITAIITAVVYKKFGKNSDRGGNLIIDSVNKQTPVPFRTIIFTFFFTILTHLTGGSGGREGAAVQIGGTVGNKLGNLFKLDKISKSDLVMTGISAGFGAIFGTPLAGAFFGMEMCFIGKLNYRAMFPCFAASFLADFVTRLLGVTHSVQTIVSIPPATLYNIAIVIGAACLFALTGKLFAFSVRKLKDLYSRLIKNYINRALIGSFVILAVMIVFDGFKYAGLSLWMEEAAFSGQVTVADPILKFVLTVLTLGTGFQAGEVTPLFNIGASIGGLIGQFASVEPSFLAALGFIAVFGCAANAPFTMVMLGIELFGTEALPYYIAAALIGYFVSGHCGLYSSQLIVVSKYPHLKNYEGKTLEEIEKKGLFHKSPK